MPIVSMNAASPLLLLKLLHTVIWAFFAGCIVLLPVAAYLDRFDVAVVLMALVAVEIVVLLANGWACPLTAVAAQHTDDRRDNFDIFLPLWLARYNKQVFGTLFLLGVAFTALRWWWRPTAG